MKDLIERAAEFARIAHAGQKDDQGRNYFTAHLEPTAKVLSLITEDKSIIAAGYLHDIIEDTKWTRENLAVEFGQRIDDLVHEVSWVEGTDKKGHTFPNLRSRDAVLIKYADRLSNLSRMEAWSEKRKEWYLGKSKFWKE